MKQLKFLQITLFLVFLSLANNCFSQDSLRNPKIVHYENDEINIRIPDLFNNAPRENFSPKHMPLYKFKEDVKGEFLRQFCDSIVSYFPYLINSIDICPWATPDSTIIVATIATPASITRSKGVIVLNESKIVLLRSENAKWLNTFSIEKTDTFANVDCSKNYLPEEDRNSLFLPDGGIDVLLASTSNNVIDITNFYINGVKILDVMDPQRERLIEWLEQFSKMNKITIGCSYTNQKTWNEFFK